MSTKKDTVRVNRKTLEWLKSKAAGAVDEEVKLVRSAVRIAKDRDERGRWLTAQKDSILQPKGETPEEIRMIQNRSVVRSAGVGALLAWLVNFDAVKNWKYVKEYWWLLPLAVLALGWWLKNRGYKDGPAILTFGGALLVQAYQKHRDEQQAQKSTSPTTPTQTAGLDTGALPQTPYAWLQDPFGRWVKVSMPASLPQYTGSFRALPPPANNNTAGPTQEDYEAAQQLAAAAFAA